MHWPPAPTRPFSSSTLTTQPTADARRERAACLSQIGQYAAAALAYEDVQRRFSASDFAGQVLIDAAANHTYAQNPQRAVDLYQRVLNEYATSAAVHQARYQLAKLLFTAGRADESQRLLGQITLAKPAPPQAASAQLLNGRIDLFLRQSRRSCRKVYRAGMTDSPTRRRPIAHTSTTQIIYMSSGCSTKRATRLHAPGRA